MCNKRELKKIMNSNRNVTLEMEKEVLKNQEEVRKMISETERKMRAILF
jgi:hypothetical protein